MTDHFIDIRYAYAQLGIDFGAPLQRIRSVLANAVAYRFSTRARTDEVQRLVDFFSARNYFGEIEFSFAEIKAAYHKQAKALHPDQNPGGKTAEDRLKDVNAAYEIVDKIHREAREYFRKEEAIRAAIEEKARAATLREAEANGWRRPPPRAPQADAGKSRAGTSWEWPKQASAPTTRKYMAASVPRYIRVSRLFYLPRQAIIGSRFIRYNAGKALVYDVIMLPEREFLRARLNLGIEGHGSPELTLSRLTPAYIPTDTRMVFVPEAEENPYLFAKSYFMEKFDLAEVA